MGDAPDKSPAIFRRGGEPWRMRDCWRIACNVLAVLVLAAVSPGFFAYQAGMWAPHLAGLPRALTVPGC